MKTYIRKIGKVKKLSINVTLFLLILSHQIFPMFHSFLNYSSTPMSDRYSQLVQNAEELRINGEFEKAIEVFDKSLELAKEIPDKEKECEALIKLGLMYWNIGKIKISSQHYRNALSIAKSHNLKHQEEYIQKSLKIYSLYNLGKKYRSSNDTQKSIDSFQKAIDLARSIQSKEHEVKCLRQLSITYWPDINIHEYFSLNEKALEIARILNHKIEEGRCLKNIGVFY